MMRAFTLNIKVPQILWYYIIIFDIIIIIIFSSKPLDGVALFKMHVYIYLIFDALDLIFDVLKCCRFK